jgi:integrase
MANYPGRRKGTRRVVIWHPSLNGKPLERVIEGTKADAEAYEAKKRIELDAQGKTEQRSALRFSQVFEAYKPHATTHLKASTWKKVRIYQVATLIEHLGDVRVRDYCGQTIDDYKRERLSQSHRGKPVTSAAVNNELRVFSAICNWGREAGYGIPEVKIRKIKRRGRDRVKFWTDDELERIFTAARELYPDLLPMLIWLLNTGARKGEALAAEWAWHDFEAGAIEIPATETWQPKSGRSRDVPMADAVRAILAGPRRHKTIVFPNCHGRMYREFPKDCFWAILAKAEVRGNPHMFRHTFASKFLHKVPDLQLLAAILGHSTTRVTELYAHLLPGRLDRAKNAVSILPQTMAVTMAKQKRPRKTRVN